MDAKNRFTSKVLVPPVPDVETLGPNFSKLPDAHVIAAIAENMAENEMFRHGIMPCVPRFDIGVDRITYFGDVIKRVQIKGQETKKRRIDKSYVFDLRRSTNGTTTGYRKNELDAFVFVHTELRLFYIIPASKILPDQTSVTFSDSVRQQWQNAWWVLKKECERYGN